MNGRNIAAVTGGTGFLGRWIVRALANAGWRPRLLVRRDPIHPQLAGVDYEIVAGSLEDGEALRRLVREAQVIVHAGGAIKALNRRRFFEANADATARIAAIAEADAPNARVLFVSSMAAREPSLSPYAASKAAGERALVDSGLRNWLILRPAAVYGPWDRETFRIFAAAAGKLMPVPHGNGARVCLIHASDVAAAVARLSVTGASGSVFELSDACHTGHAWPVVAAEARRAVGGNARIITLPAPVFRLAGLAGIGSALALQRPVMFTWAKAREVLHPDWSSAPEHQPPPDVWQPEVSLRRGFESTARWYVTNRWLAAKADLPG